MKRQATMTQLKPFFSFPFQDSQANSRFIAGCALLLSGFIVPIIPGLFVYGYALRIMQSTVEGEPPSMPSWDDWASLFNLGLRGAIVSFLFTLPATAAYLFGIAVYFGTFILIPLSSNFGSSSSDLLFFPFLFAMGAMFLSMAIGTVLLVLGTFPLPASIAHLIKNDQLSAAFRVREWWPILSTNRLGYIISFVIVAGILGIAYYAFFVLYSTIILLCLAFFILPLLGFYTMLVAAALFGETYREGSAALKKRT